MLDLFGTPIDEEKKPRGQHNVFIQLGASNHASSERAEGDFYATDPKAVEMLCDLVPLSNNIWEPACGMGHMAEVLKSRGHVVRATDLVNRGYGESPVDFLLQTEPFEGDIITNPPFKFATEFCFKAIELVTEGHKVCMFLRLICLEGKGRWQLFKKFPPKCLYVASRRILCAKNGDFKTALKNGGGVQCYAWFVWEKGWSGDTILKWFNTDD